MASAQAPSVAPLQWGESYGALILAAGLSTRMVENKVLLPWRGGQPIVSHIAAKYLRAGVREVLVVTGRDAERVAVALSPLDAQTIHNPDYATGEMLSSLKVGLGGLPAGLEAVFIQPADMPCVPVAAIERLMAEHEPGWNVAPRYAGRRGHPVLLDRAHWSRMLGLPAGAAPRDGLRRVKLVEVADAGVLLDMDTRGTYEALLRVGVESSSQRKTRYCRVNR